MPVMLLIFTLALGHVRYAALAGGRGQRAGGIARGRGLSGTIARGDAGG
jgi:hypothetical protein